MRAIFVALGLVLIVSRAEADVSVANVLEMADSSDQQVQMLNNTFIAGFVHGLIWADTEYEQEGKGRLFCPPPKLVITPAVMIQLLRNYMKGREPFKVFSFGLVGISVLRDAFPCK